MVNVLKNKPHIYLLVIKQDVYCSFLSVIESFRLKGHKQNFPNFKELS